MATVHAFFPIARTMGNLTFYVMHGKNYARKKSSLSGKKVKTHAAFARTRHYANLMGTASKIGSALYQALPVRWRQSWMYRSFTGEALQLLKAGRSIEETTETLKQLYIDPVSKRPVASEPLATPKRAYTKKHPTYWSAKTRIAKRRQLKRQKLQFHAGLLARASTLASTTYRNLPAHQRKHIVYKKITGLIIQLLKNEATAILQPAVIIKLIPDMLDVRNTA